MSAPILCCVLVIVILVVVFYPNKEKYHFGNNSPEALTQLVIQKYGAQLRNMHLSTRQFNDDMKRFEQNIKRLEMVISPKIIGNVFRSCIKTNNNWNDFQNCIENELHKHSDHHVVNHEKSPVDQICSFMHNKYDISNAKCVADVDDQFPSRKMDFKYMNDVVSCMFANKYWNDNLKCIRNKVH